VVRYIANLTQRSLDRRRTTVAPRSLVDRLLSPAGFGLALLLFLLPFATVSCSAAEGESSLHLDYTFTGLDLVTGGAPVMEGTVLDDDGSPISVDEVSDEAGFAEQFGRPVQPLAVIAGLGLLIGMIATFALPIALRAPVGAAIAIGVLVLVAVEVLAVLPAEAEAELPRVLAEAGPVTHTRPAIGFYLIVVVLVGLVAREILAARPGASPGTTTPLAAAPDATGPPDAGPRAG
jgi:hypothetical protein